MSGRPRIAIGPTDVAGSASALASGLRTNGADVEVVLWSPHPGEHAEGRELGRARRALWALRAPLRRDVLHLQYGSSWAPGNADVRWARAWNATLVAHYHGDDCRLAEVAQRLSWPLAPLKDPAADPVVRGRLRRVGALCHAAIVGDLELLTYVEPYFRSVYVAPLPVRDEPAANEDVAARSERLVVVHAPSDRIVKGTATITAAVESVARTVPLELRVLTGVPYRTVTSALRGADIVIDQMGSASASMFALDAMRAGVPVLSRVDRRAFAPFHEGLPIQPITEDSLPSVLEALARDESTRRRLGDEGRAYVARTHAAPLAARAALHVYEHSRDRPAGTFVATADGVEPLETDIASP
jgi:glycosyltransferase involved in cell wall biosynthesis